MSVASSRNSLPPYDSVYPDIDGLRRDEAGVRMEEFTNNTTVRDVNVAIRDFAKNLSLSKRDKLDRIQIKGLERFVSYYYKLETFTERRSSSTQSEPATTYAIESSAHGDVPDIWDIAATPDALYKSHDKKFEVPCTVSIEKCSCNGKPNSCKRCSGRGRIHCIWCLGLGGHRADSDDFQGRDPCIHCFGSGTSTCTVCDGGKGLACSNCSGSGKVKKFSQLKVSWNNNVEDFVVNESDLGDNLLRAATGKVLFEERGSNVHELVDCLDKQIMAASRDLIAKAKVDYSDERVIEQRQTLQAIPVTLVACVDSTLGGHFFVYGLEGQLRFPYAKRRNSDGGCVLS